VVLDGRSLTLAEVVAVSRHGAPVMLSEDPRDRAGIDSSRDLVRSLVQRDVPIYGVTTGFGDSVHRQIAAERAPRLQHNLIQFLGCGTGPTTPVPTARAVTLIRANSLARGHSGVRRELVQGLLDLLNHQITPIIPEEGSVGASGDLVPLSYLAAALTGGREVDAHGCRRPSADALEAAGLTPLVLEPKEGLALVNGTAFMTALAALAISDAERLSVLCDLNTALSTEVLNGISGPFHPFVHDVAKPHPGQIQSARLIRNLLAGSDLVVGYDQVIEQIGATDQAYRELSVQIQDKYSLRCAPQFNGVLRDTLEWVQRWLGVEMNSSSDNPLFEVTSGQAVSGGNFAGGHVALAMDALKTAVASIADLMDRQLELVVDEKFNHGLTSNLVAQLPSGHPEHGINHGFKGMQLACSSLTAEALSKCMPLTVFSRSTECHNQDKVSMGATAARQARDVVALTEKVAVIQLLALCQAADLRGATRLGRTRLVYERVRKVVAPLRTDRPMDGDIAAVLHLLNSGELLAGLSPETERSQCVPPTCAGRHPARS
jgi:histidine ammonia-lyase/phenylalanine ammonia-lyase